MDGELELDFVVRCFAWECDGDCTYIQCANPRTPENELKAEHAADFDFGLCALFIIILAQHHLSQFKVFLF